MTRLAFHEGRTEETLWGIQDTAFHPLEKQSHLSLKPRFWTLAEEHSSVQSKCRCEQGPLGCPSGTCRVLRSEEKVTEDLLRESLEDEPMGKVVRPPEPMQFDEYNRGPLCQPTFTEAAYRTEDWENHTDLKYPHLALLLALLGGHGSGLLQTFMSLDELLQLTLQKLGLHPEVFS